MDPLLDLDTRAPYIEDDPNEELLLYKPLNLPVMYILKIAKNEDRSYLFTFCEMPDNMPGDEEIQSYNEIILKPGQVRMI